jgi:hypothetical protein
MSGKARVLTTYGAVVSRGNCRCALRYKGQVLAHFRLFETRHFIAYLRTPLAPNRVAIAASGLNVPHLFYTFPSEDFDEECRTKQVGTGRREAWPHKAKSYRTRMRALSRYGLG